MQKVVTLLLFYFVTVSIQAQDKFIIKRIEITGNKITKNSTILKELSFNKGDTISAIDLVKKIQESEENLKNLQLFNFSSIKFWKNSQGGFKINITVIERWYIWGAPIFEISDRNFNVWWDEFKESSEETVSDSTYVNTLYKNDLDRNVNTNGLKLLIRKTQ